MCNCVNAIISEAYILTVWHGDFCFILHYKIFYVFTFQGRTFPFSSNTE